MDKDKKYYDLREEFDDEIHRIKAWWWMRYGILTSFLILAIIIILSSIIKYPDVIYGTFRLLSSNPAITVPLPQNVQIDKLLKKDGDFLVKGDPILLFKNTSDYEDILYLQGLLSKPMNTHDDFNDFFEEARQHSFELGELQETWSQLYALILDHYLVTKQGRYEKRVKQIVAQLEKQNQLEKKMKELIDRDRAGKLIRIQTLAIDSTLYINGAITLIEFLSRKEDYINMEKGLKQNELTDKRYELDIISLNNTIESIHLEKQEYLLTISMQITEALNKLKSGINQWRERYLVEAHTDGVLNFLGNFEEKKFINTEDAIVVTPVSENYKALLQIPLAGAGKVERDQKVHLKLEDYPFREYGYLESRLLSVSNVAGTDNYLALIDLGEVIKTNDGSDIKVKENMVGIAEIITKDRSLLTRVFDKFIYIFRN